MARRHHPLLIALLTSSAFAVACATLPEPTPPDAVSAAAPTIEPAPPPPVRREIIAGIELSADALPHFYALPETPPDLLSRVVSRFALPVVDQPAVANESRWFARHPDYIDRVLERARLYLPHVAAEVEARGMPGEIAFLPVVESAYDPFAYSHGRAAGMWQIIPGTGKRFGLKQNWWYDGRRDVVDSTRAALDYLEYLAEEFDGDWLLAIAAYNSGEGNVARAIRRNVAAGKPTEFWHLGLPAETRAYVPRLMGLAAVLKDPAAFGLELPELADTPAFAEVPLDGQLDLSLAAELAAVPLDAIYALNPGSNRWATDPEGPHRLLVPIDAVESFTAALERLPATERVRWQRYRVASGDSLIAIARKHRTTPDVIREVNGLTSDRIRLGEHLMIPTARKGLADYSLSAPNRLAATQNRPRAGRERVSHTVKNGESFWTIARGHGVGVRELAAWNGMAPGDTLNVGRRLVVWKKGAGTSVAAAPADRRVRQVRYTVRTGDSLSLIATRFRVTVNDLRAWNGLEGGKYLQPGQKLVMFVDVTAQSGGG